MEPMLQGGGGRSGTAEEITRLVEESLPTLAPHLRRWVEAHRVPPTRRCLAADSEGQRRVHVWLVTDHVGSEDSSYRVVYDEEAGKSGLEVTLQDGTEWYMGCYGGLCETIENM
jgi:hypothetical protein